MRKAVALYTLVIVEVLAVASILFQGYYNDLPSIFVNRLDIILQTAASAEMELLYVVLLGFYVLAIFLMKGIQDTDFPKIGTVVLFAFCFLLYLVLLLFQRVGGDVQRSLTFAAMLTQGYDPYALTGAEVNKLIISRGLNYPIVQSYLDQPFSYPSVTLLAYTFVVFISPSTTFWAITWQMLLTALRLIGGVAVWKGAGQLGQQRIPLTALYLLNPMLLYTAHDGKEEAVMVVAALAAMYFFLARKPVRSGVALALSFASKFVTAALLPGFLILSRGLKKRLEFSVGFIVAVALSALPLLLGSPYVLTFVGWQLSRPCNSPLNLTCFNYHSVWIGFATIACGIAWLWAVWHLVKPSGWLDYVILLSFYLIAATILLGRSYFLWYLDWFTPLLYLLSKPRQSVTLAPHALILVGIPAMLLLG